MKIVQYTNGGQMGCGVQIDDKVFYSGYDDTISLIRDGERGLEHAAAMAESADPVRFDRIVAPLKPGKIFGSGVNYRSHGDEEENYEFPDEVVWDFIKLPSSVIGPDEPIVLPPEDDVIKRRPGGSARFSEHGFAVDYEVELGVVISRQAKNIRAEDAMEYIFGYTIINDVGSRSVQFHNRQADLGKNFDTFCPMGPCIVTRDELPGLEGHSYSVTRERRTSSKRTCRGADRSPLPLGLSG